jgi:hypothetical protein
MQATPKSVCVEPRLVKHPAIAAVVRDHTYDELRRDGGAAREAPDRGLEGDGVPTVPT